MMFSLRAPRTWMGMLVSLALALALATLTFAPWWTTLVVAAGWAVLIFCDEFADWEG